MISFVYFDLGGVAELDFSKTNKWEELKSGIGVNEKNRGAFDVVWKRHHDNICIDCDVDTLIPVLEKEVGLSFPPNYSMLSDFVNRFEPNPSIWPVIEKIIKTCRVGLLTNAYPRMLDAIRERGILPPVDWDAVVDSSVIGYQKPDPRIYEIAETEAKAKGDQILFVENSPEHIEGAQKFGWKTFLYDPSEAQKSSLNLLIFFLQKLQVNT